MLTSQRVLGDEVLTSLVRNLGLMDKQSLKVCITDACLVLSRTVLMLQSLHYLSLSLCRTRRVATHYRLMQFYRIPPEECVLVCLLSLLE